MEKQKFSVLFYGTSSFAVPSLKAIMNDERFSVIGVVTQPDRPVGRHAEIQASPVKQAALGLRLPVYQYEKVKSDEAYEDLKTHPADVAVVASFGQIIPQRVIDLYPHGMINVHGSILPKYRGASPIAAAILNGDRETGVTIMKMDALMDHGPTLATAAEPIQEEDTTPTLEKRLATLGAKILPDVLFDDLTGKLTPQEQDHAAATSVKLLSRENGKIDWHKPAHEIERQVRAYAPWPGTYTTLNGKRLKIMRAGIGSHTEIEAGTGAIENKLPAITCGDQTNILLLEVQPEGKAVMDGKAFLAGQHGWGKVKFE